KPTVPGRANTANLNARAPIRMRLNWGEIDEWHHQDDSQNQPTRASSHPACGDDQKSHLALSMIAAKSRIKRPDGVSRSPDFPHDDAVAFPTDDLDRGAGLDVAAVAEHVEIFA